MLDEKTIELFVLFQEKLALKINDSNFRRNLLEPLLSGVTEQALEAIVDDVLQDPELKGLSVNEPIRKSLNILLKKLIERFSKFQTEINDDYIG